MSTHKTLPRLGLFATAAVLAASGAAAQDAPASNRVELDAVVVTAQKRAENIQDAPLTIQSLSGDRLAAAGVSNTQDLQTLVPGLTFSQNQTAAIPYLRGVGQQTGAIGAESPVAIYIDGVYLVAPASGVFSFNNVERIEVAKGPQGTLFGRNSTGGVIHVVTKQPKLDFDWYGSVGYANYETKSADLYVTGAVSPTISSSLSAYIVDQHKGYFYNAFLNRRVGRAEDYGIQNKWLWTPTDDTEVGLNLLYNWHYGPLGTTLAPYPGTLADDGVTRYVDRYTVFTGVETRHRDSQALAALTVRHDFGAARLTSITSWHQLWDNWNYIQNANPIHVPRLPRQTAVVQHMDGGQETKTQELQLQAPADADFQWVLGAFYLYDKTKLAVDNKIEGFLTPTFIRTSLATESYALYLDGSKTILPKTRLTLGLRYTKEEKNLYGNILSINAAGVASHSNAAVPGGGFPPLETPKSWTNWTYRAVVDHKFNDDIMVYASYNRGFKSGGLNITSFTNAPTNPEILQAYEVGIKSELLERRLRLNVSAFYYDYEDIQLRQTSAAFPGRIFLLNAASAEVKGIDVDFTAIPARGLTISGGFEVLDAHYTNFPGAPTAFANPITAIPAGCTGSLTAGSPFPGGNTSLACDASGNRMIRSPKFTGNIGVSYAFDLSGGATMTLDATDHYNSGFFWDPDNVLTQKAYHNIRGAVTWTAPSGRWDLVLWGRNLTDAHIFTTATAGISSTHAPGVPRTYGVTLKMRR